MSETGPASAPVPQEPIPGVNSGAIPSQQTQNASRGDTEPQATKASGPGPQRTHIGSYDLLNKLGEGGMGAVYKARHQHLKKIVAVKVLAQSLTEDPAALARFMREMEAVGSLDHPHIVRAMDAGEDQGTHFLVMEFIEGQDLVEFVKKRGPLSANAACRAILQAALGLEHAHKHGLVHRDIKPSNLFLTNTGTVKILDLGLARLTADGVNEGDQGVTRMGQILGTPDFMSPEQWEAKGQIDGRSDLYSLGGTLFYLLMGRAPFYDDTRRTMMHLMTSHLSGAVPDLCQLRPDLPAEVGAIFRKLMAKATSDRYSTASELIPELRRIIENQTASKSGIPKSAPTGEGLATVRPAPNVAHGPILKEVAPPAANDKSAAPVARSRRAIFVVGALGLSAVVGAVAIFGWSRAPDNKVTSKNVTSVKSKKKAPAPEQRETPTQTTPAIVTPPAKELAPVIPEESQAAAWILAAGGRMQAIVDGNSISIASPDDLPKSQFWITEVNLAGRPVSREGLEKIAKLKKVDSLNLYHSGVTNDDLAALRGAESITKLNLGGSQTQPASVKLTDACIDYLMTLPNLSYLQIDQNEITDVGLKRIGGKSTLRHLDVSGLPITDQGLAAIAGLPLTALNVGGRSLTAQSMEAIGSIKTLERLFCDAGQFNAATGKLLAQLPALRLIVIWGEIDPQSLEGFSVLTQVETLQLMNTYLRGQTRRGLKAVLAMPGLKHLELQEGNINDITAQELAGATRLVSLRISGTQISELGLNKLKTALPACKIEAQLREGVVPLTAASLDVLKPRPFPIKAPRVEIPAAKSTFKAGRPLGSRAMVQRPATIRDLQSWSVEIAGHNGCLEGVEYSPDGQFLISIGSNDNTIRVWRPEEVEGLPVLQMSQLFIGAEGYLTGCDLSPDGQTLATVSTRVRQVDLYDVPSGRRLRTITLPSESTRVAWSPNGRLLAVGANDHLAMIEPVKGTIRKSEQAAAIGALSWSPDGSQVASVDGSAMLRFWNAGTLQMTFEFDTKDRGNRAVEWSPDGRWIATLSEEGIVRLWDSTNRREVQTIKIDRVRFSALCWEPKTASELPNKHAKWPRLAIGQFGDSNAVTVYDPVTGKPLGEPTRYHGEIAKITWSPDGSLLAVAHPEVVRVYDAATGKAVAQSEDRGKSYTYARHVELSADGETVRTQAYSNYGAWSAETGERLQIAYDFPGGAMSASPDNKWLAVFAWQGESDFLNLIDATRLDQRRPLLGHTLPISSAVWAHDSSVLATSGSDSTVRLWNPLTGEQVRRIDHSLPVKGVIWSPDDKRILTWSDDDVIRVWDAKSGEMLRAYDRLPISVAGGSQGIAWSPASDYVVLANRDGGARAFDLKTGRLGDTLIQFQGSVGNVVFSRDGKKLLIGNGGEAAYRTLSARETVTSIGFGSPFYWHPDKRRFLCGMNGYHTIQGLDIKKGQVIGSLFPNLSYSNWACIGGTGHYRGSADIDDHLVYVAQHKDGAQVTYRPHEFREAFDWKNDPDAAQLLKLDNP